MARKMSEAELQRRGLDLLIEALGYPSAVRFVLSCSRTGRDYSKERHKLFNGVTLEQLLAESDKIVARSRARTRRKSA